MWKRARFPARLKRAEVAEAVKLQGVRVACGGRGVAVAAVFALTPREAPRPEVLRPSSASAEASVKGGVCGIASSAARG